MRKYITPAVIGLLAGVGAARVAVWACEGMACALTRWGGWQAAEAAQAAPVILLALAAGLALSLWGLHEDNKRYSRSGYGKVEGYGRITRTHARNPEYPENEERGA